MLELTYVCLLSGPKHKQLKMFVYFQDPKTQTIVKPVHDNNGNLNMQNLDQIQLILTKQIWTKPI